MANTAVIATLRITYSAAVTYLAATPRSPNIDASEGAVKEVERIVSQIRQTWPRVRIILRTDSGFAHDGLMAWSEPNAIYCVFSLVRNVRLETSIARLCTTPVWLVERAANRPVCSATSCGRPRTVGPVENGVIGKAEWTLMGQTRALSSPC